MRLRRGSNGMHCRVPGCARSRLTLVAYILVTRSATACPLNLPPPARSSASPLFAKRTILSSSPLVSTPRRDINDGERRSQYIIGLRLGLRLRVLATPALLHHTRLPLAPLLLPSPPTPNRSHPLPLRPRLSPLPLSPHRQRANHLDSTPLLPPLGLPPQPYTRARRNRPLCALRH